MYARYIPPPKEEPKSDSQRPLAGAFSKPTHSVPVEDVARSQIHDTAVAQPKRIVFDDEDFPLPDPKKPKHSRDDELTGTAEKEPKRSRKTDTTKNLSPAPEHENTDAKEQALKESIPMKNKKKNKKKKGAEKPEEVAGELGTSEADLAPGAKGVHRDVPAPVEEAPGYDRSRSKREKKKKIKELGDDLANEEETVSIGRQRHKAVFERLERALQLRPATLPEDEETGTSESEPEPQEVHGLEPLPQPEPVKFDESKLTYETLPPWLASPIRVTNDARSPFTELGVPTTSAKILTSKGFVDAFAVQTAVLPLLQPSPDRQGDVVVAAPTGSGKTLSYVLPMVQDISKGIITRLRGIIILPTRELVQQVQLACDACVAAFAIGDGKRVKIGTAVGNRMLKTEQAAIMGQEQRYDPVGYAEYLRKRKTAVSLNDDEDYFDLDPTQPEPLPYHSIAHISKVDILICTPGRLVEHVNKTPGFSLDYVRWLIVDEADKLLAQDYQQWLGVVLKGLSATTKPGARDFPGSNKTGPRKVILSATMTSDISLLNGLRLSRPRLVLLEGTKAGEQTLPALLKEFTIKVREPSHKPLYLLALLNSEHLVPVHQNQEDNVLASAETTESESSSDSDTDSSTAKRRFNATVLIFTNSNESALRLCRLLEILSPDLAPLIGYLTSSAKTSKRAHTLRDFTQGKLRILVVSDLVSRGIDLRNLDHVINYDIPISETSYVHRVGRTARAGRAGYAWTLLEYAEGRRFWRDFAGEGKSASTSIVRSGKVKRVTLGKGEGEEFNEESVKAYEAALEQLKREAAGRK